MTSPERFSHMRRDLDKFDPVSVPAIHIGDINTLFSYLSESRQKISIPTNDESMRILVRVMVR
jgi:hypothetical protein